ncbi:hypothetical protein EB118_09815 [bacterium]|nr:hypothetical protein [bacterium]
MKVNEILTDFQIWTSKEERRVLEQLRVSRPLNSFPEHDQFIIEQLIRKSLVIKIGERFPNVIANEPKL